MIKRIVIGLLLLIANGQWLMAISTEEEQQFTYYWYAAKQAIAQERYDDALVYLEFCRMIQPNDGQTLSYIALLYKGLGQQERAMETFRLAFEASPRDQWQKYCYTLLELRTEEGMREALRVMEKAYGEGERKKVKGERGKVKGERCKDEELLEQLRRMYMSTGQWAKAIAMQDELDQLNGPDAYSAINRWRAYMAWAKPKKAMEALDLYLEQDPTNVQLQVLKAESMEHMKIKQDVLFAQYERVLNLDPHNLYILNNYAYFLSIHGGDLQKAERMSAITIREEPSNAIYLDTYGWILHLQGQDELALFYLNRAMTHAADEHTKKVVEKHIQQIKR